jgi:uncharacterized PurR-regulated membrane protein YhhQ (DUF165 family)
VAQAPHTHVQRASRGLLAVARGDRKSHDDLRNRLLAIIWVTLLIMFISTPALYFAERHASGTGIHSLWDAFLFTLSQLVTASSVASPASQTGKVLELAFDIYAITVVATLAGSFGAFFHHRREEDEKDAAKAAKATSVAASAAAATARTSSPGSPS